MLIDIKSVSSFDKRGRVHLKRVMHICCDFCGNIFDKAYDASILKKKNTFCKENCRQNANKPGGLVHNLNVQSLLALHNDEVRHSQIIEKTKKTKTNRYGNENFTNREKAKVTHLHHYGVEFPLQRKDIFQKTQTDEAIEKRKTSSRKTENDI